MTLAPQGGVFIPDLVIPAEREAREPESSIPETVVTGFRVRGLRPRPGMTNLC
jgi:hypothetical protein